MSYVRQQVSSFQQREHHFQLLVVLFLPEFGIMDQHQHQIPYQRKLLQQPLHRDRARPVPFLQS